MNADIYEPTVIELRYLHKHCKSEIVKEIVAGVPLQIEDPVPIRSEKEARKYLNEKVAKYRSLFQTRRSVEAIIESTIATAYNLKGPYFTYANLYARTHTFLIDPHIAAALAFNALYKISDIPDEIDIQFGLTYK